MTVLNKVVKKVPIRYGCQSLIGTLSTRPVDWGNYFSLIVGEENADVRIANMWAENLKDAESKFLDGEVELTIYQHQKEDGRTLSWALVTDDRIPDDYLYNKLCFTGTSSPPADIITDMFDIVGDPDGELEQYIDPISYYSKKGNMEYNPETGIIRVSYKKGD